LETQLIICRAMGLILTHWNGEGCVWGK
jgi:hypothetical protein